MDILYFYFLGLHCSAKSIEYGCYAMKWNKVTENGIIKENWNAGRNTESDW